MDIKCPLCRKKNLISNHYCHNCAADLHTGKKQLKLISYNSPDEFLLTLPGSDYYRKRLRKKEQKKFIFLCLFIIFFFLFGSTIVIFILLKYLKIF
jgi:hypothetical protein